MPRPIDPRYRQFALNQTDEDVIGPNSQGREQCKSSGGYSTERDERNDGCLIIGEGVNCRANIIDSDRAKVYQNRMQDAENQKAIEKLKYSSCKNHNVNVFKSRNCSQHDKNKTIYSTLVGENEETSNNCELANPVVIPKNFLATILTFVLNVTCLPFLHMHFIDCDKIFKSFKWAHSALSVSYYPGFIFGKRYSNLSYLTQYIMFFLILLSAFNNVETIKFSEPQILYDSSRLNDGNGNVNEMNETVSNLTLKINAVQQNVNRLIDALTVNSTTSDPTISFSQMEQGTGNFTRPNQGDKFTKLEDELKRMKEDIKKLVDAGNITNEDKTRLANLESSVEILQKLIDNQKREIDEKFEELNGLIEFLLGTIKELRTEIDNLKRKAELEEEDRKKRRLPTECIEAIKSHDFATAERKLQEINDDTKINLIVNSVYDHHQSNFELLLRFAESITVKQRNLLVLKALNYEMENNGHKDLFKMIKLVRSVKKQIIDNQNTSSEVKTQAESFEDYLKISIKTIAKEKMKQAMLNNNYESNDIKNLSNDVYSVSNQLFKNLINEVVNEVYKLMDTKNLLKHIKSHSLIQQSIPGYYAVFNKLRHSNSDSWFNLAYYTKEAIEATSFTSLDSDNKSILDQIKNSLPRSVRNVAFASEVCFKNVIYPEYLYASGKYLHDGPRRHVFTWMPNSKKDVQYKEDHWKLIRTDDSFYIFNVARQEYMYSPSEYKDFKQGNDRRKVFTWTEGNRFDSCKWNMEPVGDDVRIKSVVRSEYLYTSNKYKHKNVNQKIFTWIPGGPVRNGLWTIVDCSNA